MTTQEALKHLKKKSAWPTLKVKAWMPIPEPYREE